MHVACRKLAEHVAENALKVELMHLTHQELKPRLNYFAGFGAEGHVFRVEESHPSGVDQPFLQIDDLKVPSLNFDQMH